MAKREKFGKFVLLEELDSSGVGSEFRAAKLSNTGLEKIVALLRLNASVSGNADVAKALMDHTKVAAQLQNPNVVRIHGIGKVDWAYYISSEFIEGKSLKAIFKRCRQEGFPFSVDHALLIASKICSALEYAHGRKNDAGGRYFHGLVNPGQVLVSYEGEVRTRGFGSWPAHVRELGVLTAEELQYLAPEQDGGPGDTRSDTYAVGAMLFEMLTGHPLPSAARGGDAMALVAQARLQNPTSDDDSIPKPLADILQRSLAADPAGRYAEIQEMRKALDTLLFSGDFTPTTFNLAFFMHSLFREDIDRESKALKEEKEASYLEYLTEDAKPATAPPPAPKPAAVVPPPAPVATPPAAAAPPPPPAPVRDTQEFRPAPEPPSAGPSLPPHEAAAGLSFGKDGEKKAGSKAPLFIGLAAVIAIGVGAGIFMMRGKAPEPTPPPTPPPTTLSPEIQAQLARLKEYEDKLKAIEEEAKKKEEAAKEEAKKKLEAQAKAKGEQLDPAALQKAQDEAAKKARAEQEKKAEEERKKLEEQKRIEEERLAEQKRIEEQRLAEEKKKQDAAAAAAAAAQPQPPATQAAAAQALRPGTLVNLSDPGVMPPELASQSQLQYPPIALRQRVEGVVELSVLVDEKGTVADAQVVRGAGGRAGLNEAAVDSVKRRKYRPATKDGVPVKVWISVSVKFQLPK